VARKTLGGAGSVPGERLDPAFAPVAAAALARRIRADGAVAWDADRRTADGRPLPVRVAVEREDHPDDARLLCGATARAPLPPAAGELQALRRSDRMTFVESPQPLCVQDASFRLVRVNAAFVAMTGYAETELIGRDPHFLVAPEQVAEDPTVDRGRVDDVIRDNEIFRLLFEESPSAKSIQDAEYRLVKVKRACCGMFGYEAAEVLGRDPLEWTAADDRDMILEQRQRQRALRGEHLPSTLTRRILREDGSLRICRLVRHTTYASDGSRIELITLHDETDEIRMQQRLRADWQRVERFFEQAPVGLMIADATGRVALVNRVLGNIVGRSRDRLIGSPDSLDDSGSGESGRVGGRHRTTWTRDDPGLNRIQYVNTCFETIWGTSMTELVQRPRAIFDNVLAEHRADVAGLFDGKALGAAHESVLRLQHPRLGLRSVRLPVATAAVEAGASAASAWPVPAPRDPLRPGSEAFGVAVDPIERARGQVPDPLIEAMAVGVLMARHRLSAAAARRRLGAPAIDRGTTESSVAAEILTAVALLSGPSSPTG
jgi:PAS domain S-box-containing protein